MEGIAGEIREMAYGVYPLEQMEQKWRTGAGIRGTAAGGDHRNQGGKRLHGQHHGKSAPGWDGCFKASGRQSIGRSRGGLTTKIHMITASDRAAVDFSLSGGQVHDAPQGIALRKKIRREKEQKYLLMDRAYEGENVRTAALEQGFEPVVPPKKNRRNPWVYDKERYKQLNEIERFFLRLKRFRRICTRYDKLDIMFRSFILFALIFDAL